MSNAKPLAGAGEAAPLGPDDLDFLVDPAWEMSVTERAGFLGLVMAAKPDWAVEVGTAGGGSLAVLARVAARVVSIDIDRSCEERLGSRMPNVEFRAGRSQRLLEPALDDAMAGGGRGVVFIDGDHDPMGVSADVGIVIDKRPVDGTLLIMHDTQMAATREALELIDWHASPWVHRLMLDLVSCENPEFGGIGVAFLSPEPRVGDSLDPASRNTDAVVMSGSPDWRPDLSPAVRAGMVARKWRKRLAR